MKLSSPVLGLLALAACQKTPPRSPVEAATLAACRERADEIYDRQNRVDLSRREERDAPFASTYNSGITTQGLGARFERGQRIDACTGAASGTGASPGPAMDPAQGGTSRGVGP